MSILHPPLFKQSNTHIHTHSLSLSLGYHTHVPNVGFMGFVEMKGAINEGNGFFVITTASASSFSFSSSFSFAILVIIYMCLKSLGSRFRMSLKNLIICIDSLA